MNDFEDGYVQVGDVRLHYVEAGSGPLIILYHGFPFFWYSFHHQMRSLKDEFRVVAIDGLGVNLSDKPGDLSLYKVSNLAEQIDALAQHLIGDDVFHLVGHDWGGALAWSYAQQYPQRLKKVVAINAPPTNQLIGLLESNPEQQRRSAYMWDMRSGKTHEAMTRNGANQVWKNACAGLRGLPHFTPEDDEIFGQGLARPGAIDGGINWYRANIPMPGDVSDEDFWPSRTASTSVPGLLIWGEDDRTFIPEFIDDLPRFVDNLTVTRLPGLGHSPMLEDPERVSSLLRDFFGA